MSIQFTWWLMSQPDNQPLCEISVSHDGPPIVAEVTNACGPDLAQQWQDTPECSSDLASNAPCTGLYLQLGNSQAVAAQDQSSQPAASLWLELVGCTRLTQAWICDEIPILRFVRDEQQGEDRIAAINVVVDDQETDCAAPTCDVPLQPTPEEGVEILFSFTATSGAGSVPQRARVRVVMAPLPPGTPLAAWQVEVLGSQFRDDRMDRCGLAWDSLPGLKDRPSWLSIPEESDELWTSEPYVYLEERLSNLGLAEDGFAGDGFLLAPADHFNVGERSETLIVLWQNQFDAAILDAALLRGLPAPLIKRMFATESQFWPGSYPEIKKVGLGHMSEFGADTLLLWSPPYFAEFCPQVLHPDSCKRGYSLMPEDQKAMVRAALLGAVNSDCADCTFGLDLVKAGRSVAIFSESLIAYCSQTGQVMVNATRNTPGLLSTYEDLWRFTLANYNAGSGCMTQALSTTWRLRQPMDWSHVATNLPAGCQSAIEYVSKVLVEKPVQTTAGVEEPLSLTAAHAPGPGPDTTSLDNSSRQ